MNRFFVKPDDMTEDSAAIIGEDVKHISKVLRMQSGDRVMLSDGCGYEYLAEIETISRERVELKLLDKKNVSCRAEAAHNALSGYSQSGQDGAHYTKVR